MKDLWLSRLGRPDVAKAIGNLAKRVSCWSRNDDKRLRRLMDYLHTTTNWHLTGHVGDPLENCRLELYVDADFCGEVEHTKSNLQDTLESDKPKTQAEVPHTTCSDTVRSF